MEIPLRDDSILEKARRDQSQNDLRVSHDGRGHLGAGRKRQAKRNGGDAAAKMPFFISPGT